MPNLVIASDREFQLWKYTVGHSQLLLRSTKSPEFPTRIDVFFKGVVEIQLPTHFRGLFLTEGNEDEIAKIHTSREQLSFKEGVKVFTVRGAGFFGYVAALVVATHEDKGEYYEPSYFAKGNII
jgi:hypothetical protein